MNPKSTFWIQGLIAFVITAFLVGCEANPTQPGEELVVAAGKPVKPPKPSTGAELELLSYSVESVVGPHGFTNNPSEDVDVNADVYEYLDLENPPGGLVPPNFSTWEDYLGCPDGSKNCSAVTLVMNGGKALTFYASAVPVVGSCGSSEGACLLDEGIINRRDATVRGGLALPSIPWDLIKPAFETDSNGNTTFTFYWQGQRGMKRTWVTGTEKVRGKERDVYDREWHWDRFPNLYPQTNPDQFFFHPYFQVGQRTYYHPTISGDNLLTICGDTESCLAEFQGKPGEDDLSVSMTLDSFEDGVAEIKVMAFSPSEGGPNPESFARVMMTHGGDREMLEYDWQNHTSVRRDGEAAATWFRVEGLVLGECYQFDLVGLIVVESEWETFAVDNRLVWTGGTAPIFIGEGCPPN